MQKTGGKPRRKTLGWQQRRDGKTEKVNREREREREIEREKVS